MKKKVFVTGVCGFIGFHAAQALSKRGDEVVGIDNFNAYYPPQLKRRRQEELQKLDVEIMEGDISDKTLLKTLFKIHHPTHVLHLAAQAGVRYARENPDAYLKSNVEGFLALLETLKTHPHIPLVYASSSSVYGCNEKIPFSEEDRTDLPANLYAATKKSNELMAFAYHHLYNIPCTALRYFTVYGPWGRPDMAYFAFTKQLLEDKPIRLFNGGKMKRDFTYIDDAVAATLTALDKAFAYEIFNVGNCHPEEITTLISLLEKEFNKKASIILEGSSPGEVETTYADIEKAKRLLDFNPSTSLEQGISQFCAWHKNTYKVY